MPTIIIPITTDNFHKMGCRHPDVDIDDYSEDELIDGLYAPCIGPDCSDWSMEYDCHGGCQCEYLEGAWQHNQQKTILRNMFMQAVEK